MDIIFSEINQTGIIKLNRPNSLNALNLDMAKKLIDKLLEWEENSNISSLISCLILKLFPFIIGGLWSSFNAGFEETSPEKSNTNTEKRIKWRIINTSAKKT